LVNAKSPQYYKLRAETFVAVRKNESTSVSKKGPMGERIQEEIQEQWLRGTVTRDEGSSYSSGHNEPHDVGLSE
jgi:hypothetical protein